MRNTFPSVFFKSNIESNFPSKNKIFNPAKNEKFLLQISEISLKNASLLQQQKLNCSPRIREILASKRRNLDVFGRRIWRRNLDVFGSAVAIFLRPPHVAEGHVALPRLLHSFQPLGHHLLVHLKRDAFSKRKTDIFQNEKQTHFQNGKVFF